jgi:hypothetical protein
MKLGMAHFLSYEPAECTRSFGIICASAIDKSKKIKICFRLNPMDIEIF